MSFRIIDCVQRSPEWFAARLGLLTGSVAEHVIAVRKRGTGELKERISLRRRLVCERITGCLVDDKPYQSFDMARGAEVEPAAFAAYEAETGQIVQRVGFVRHETLMAGASPDGYVGDWEGVIELKCPKQPTHLDYLQGKVVPEAYRGQVLHALWLTGAQWCDFVSFDDRFPAPLDLFVVRTRREDVDLVAYELAVTLFLAEVQRDVDALAQALVEQAVA